MKEGGQKLKGRMKNIDFFSKNIECTTPIPFDQAWSRASKKVGVVHSIDQGPKKSESEGALYNYLMRWGGASNATRGMRDVSAGATWVKTRWGHRAGVRLTAKR